MDQLEIKSAELDLLDWHLLSGNAEKQLEIINVTQREGHN